MEEEEKMKEKEEKKARVRSAPFGSDNESNVNFVS